LIKITHVITTLTMGGAEMMLYRLLSRMDRAAFEAEVIALTGMGPVGEMIQKLNVPVSTLGMRRGVPNPLGVLRLARRLLQRSPDVIQTWMYHANLIGGLAAKIVGEIPVVWGIHHSNLDPQANKRSTIWTAKVCARLSHTLPAHIIYCSESARRAHTEIGYDAAEKAEVIFNGFDLDLFKPDPAARASVRCELSIPEPALLIGLVGRFDPQKDHHNFIQAAAELHAQQPDAHFLLCGDGVSWQNETLAGWIDAAGISARCHLLSRRNDVPRLLAALDVAASSSYGEGFPNVIGEAMACGIPCVVTDVGDSALMVGDAGKVVPRRNPSALARAWHELITMNEEERQRLGEAARRRIEKLFSLDKIVGRYEAVYKKFV
jgi:glycosyltransferase involved in cell wall biosynthesis